MVPTMNPINLKVAFPRYRVALDECAESRRDPWSFVIPCRYGLIYPFSDTLLAVQCDNSKIRARRLAGLGLAVSQAGDTEFTFLFRPDQMEQVAEIVQPKRRRRLNLSDEAKASRVANMMAGRNNDSEAVFGT